MKPSPASTQTPDVRKGQGDVQLTREEFARRFGERFYDPAFDTVRDEIERIIEIAWDGHDPGRKSPRTRKASEGFADPDFELPVEWLETRAQILDAERRQRDVASPRRVLLVCGAARHDQTCPGEMSKTFRLAQLVHAALDTDAAVQEEVRNVARGLVRAVEAMREGRFARQDVGLAQPRPK